MDGLPMTRWHFIRLYLLIAALTAAVVFLVFMVIGNWETGGFRPADWVRPLW